MDQAKDTLELMKKTIGEFDKGGLTGILVGVVQQLKDQVEDLRKKGPSHQKELDETVSRFSAFLDELAKQQNLSDEVLRFLANGYASLGQHQKAADLLNQIPAPKPPLSPDQEAQYLAVHILFARELRLAGQLDRAKKVLDDMAQTEQGKRSLELKKEQIMLEEDQGNWSQAAKDWDGLMKTIRPMFGQAQRNLNVQPTPEEMKKLEKENSFRDAYFDCYYQFTYCYYKYALTMKDDHLRQQTLEKVAGLIAAVRDKQGEVWKASLKGRYDDLFQKEPLLKSLYDKQSRPAA